MHEHKNIVHYTRSIESEIPTTCWRNFNIDYVCWPSWVVYLKFICITFICLMSPPSTTWKMLPIDIVRLTVLWKWHHPYSRSKWIDHQTSCPLILTKIHDKHVLKQVSKTSNVGRKISQSGHKLVKNSFVNSDLIPEVRATKLKLGKLVNPI